MASWSWQEGLNGVNRQPSNGPKFNRQQSKMQISFNRQNVSRGFKVSLKPHYFSYLRTDSDRFSPYSTISERDLSSLLAEVSHHEASSWETSASREGPKSLQMLSKAFLYTFTISFLIFHAYIYMRDSLSLEITVLQFSSVYRVIMGV